MDGVGTIQVLTLLLLLQAPGDGWAVAQVAPREVKTVYWDLFGTSETWVSIIPPDPRGGQPLVRLIFQAFFVGREPKGAPVRIVLRAVGLPLTVVNAYSLSVVIGKDTIDLGSSCASARGSGPPCDLLYPGGEGSSANGVAVDLQQALLERLAVADSVAGTALGFPITFSSDDRAALAKFAEAIHVKTAPRR